MALSTAPIAAFRGEAFRHQSPHFDPLSGEGARLRGGRFNPRESFPTLYLCTTRPCAVAEFLRYSSRSPLGPEAFLPRDLFRYELDLTTVLDLTNKEVLDAIECRPDDLVGDDWSLPQRIGIAAHALSIQAIKCPSATGADEVLAVFPEHLGDDRIEPQMAEHWNHPTDIA